MVTCLLLFSIVVMFTGVQGGARSMSCSTVNGKTICQEQQSSGNAAQASSMSMSGPGSTYQQVGTGSGYMGGQWASNEQTVYGRGYTGGHDVPSDFDYSDSQAAPGGFDSNENTNACADDSSLIANPDNDENRNYYPDYSTNVFTDNNVNQYQNNNADNTATTNDFSGTQVAIGGGIGGPMAGGFSYVSSSSFPNSAFNMGPQPAVGGFGFAGAGVFPFPFFPGVPNPSQGAAQPSGGNPPQQGPQPQQRPQPQQGPQPQQRPQPQQGPQPFDPFTFVGGFMNGMNGGAGAFAGGGGAGAFAGGGGFGGFGFGR